MKSDSTVVPLRQPDTIEDPLTSILRSGARRLLAQAIEAEAEAFLTTMKGVQRPDGRDRVVRHGLGPERRVQTGIGPVEVRRVKLRDRGTRERAERIRFTSAILPRWARRTRSLDALLPILYLRGVSMGDFQEALAALLGREAPNLSPSLIARLKDDWRADFERWQKRDLSARRYVDIWADGVYLQARLEPQAECMLVLIGATPEGKKELVGFQVGMRESAQSWRELLVDLKARGLAIAPELPPATARSASGRRSRRFRRRRGTSAAPCTRPSTCWTSCPSLSSRRPRWTCARSGRPRTVRQPRRPSRALPKSMGPSTKGGHLPGQRSRRAADLLQLPSRALGSPAHVQPDRERVRHRPAPNRPDQGRVVTGHRQADGLQARHGRREDLAQAEG
jgi:hypothetical protein